MRKWLFFLALKVLKVLSTIPRPSEIPKEAGRYRWLVPPRKPFVLPKKLFGQFNAVPEHRKEGTCTSCFHFLAEVELSEDMIVDIHTRLSQPWDIKPYRSGPPAVFGYCLFFYPMLIGKIHCQETCPHHDRKPDQLQFEDDALTDFNEGTAVQPYKGPVVPR